MENFQNQWLELNQKPLSVILLSKNVHRYSLGNVSSAISVYWNVSTQVRRSKF